MCLSARGPRTKSGIRRARTIAENGPSVWPGRQRPHLRSGPAARPAPARCCPRPFVLAAPRRRRPRRQPHTEPFGDGECLIMLEGLIKGERWRSWKELCRAQKSGRWLKSRAPRSPRVRSEKWKRRGPAGTRSVWRNLAAPGRWRWSSPKQTPQPSSQRPAHTRSGAKAPALCDGQPTRACC